MKWGRDHLPHGWQDATVLPIARVPDPPRRQVTKRRKRRMREVFAALLPRIDRRTP